MIDGVVVNATPEVEPVLITRLKFSDPSVAVPPSATSVLVNVVIPVAETTNDPVRPVSYTHLTLPTTPYV